MQRDRWAPEQQLLPHPCPGAPGYPLSHMPLSRVLTDNALSSFHSSFLIMHISRPCDLDPAPCSETRSESCFSPPKVSGNVSIADVPLLSWALAFKITLLLMEEATRSQLNAAMFVLSPGDIMLPWQCLAAFHRGFLHFRWWNLKGLWSELFRAILKQKILSFYVLWWNTGGTQIWSKVVASKPGIAHVKWDELTFKEH